MIGFLAIVIAAAEPTAVAHDIEAFCKSRPTCVSEQRRSLRFFLNLMVVSGVPDAEAEQCMRSGKKGGVIDWTVAEQCIRNRAKSKRAIDPVFEERG